MSAAEGVWLAGGRVLVRAAAGEDPRAIWRERIRLAPEAVLGLLERDLDGLEARAVFDFHRVRSPAQFGPAPGLPGGEPPAWVDLMVKTVLVRRRRILGLSLRAMAVGNAMSGIHFGSRTAAGIRTLPHEQRRGIGRRFAFNRLLLWQAIGCRRAIGVMGMQAGAYVWARMGYLMGDASRASLANFVSRRLHSSDLEPRVPFDIRERVHAFLAEGGEDLPYRIATIETPVVGGESLGSQLLRYARWEGEFDLRADSPSWARAADYVRRTPG